MRKHITIDVPCAGEILADLSRGGSYEAAKRGEIDVITVGARKRVSVAWMENKTGVTQGGLDDVIDAWIKTRTKVKGPKSSGGGRG